jgi:hypothetical protein
MTEETEQKKILSGKRKFYFFLFVFCVVSILQAVGKLPVDGKIYESAIWAIVIGFGGGNVGEHFAKKKV